MTGPVRRAQYRAEIRASDLETAILRALDKMTVGRIAEARRTLEQAVPELLRASSRPVLITFNGGDAA